MKEKVYSRGEDVWTALQYWTKPIDSGESQNKFECETWKAVYYSGIGMVEYKM